MGFFDIFRKITAIKFKSRAKMTTSHDTLRALQIDVTKARGSLFQLESQIQKLDSIAGKSNVSDKDLADFLNSQKDSVVIMKNLEAVFPSVMSGAAALYSGLASRYSTLISLNNKIISGYKPAMPANPKNVQKAVLEYQQKLAQVQRISDLNKAFSASVENIRNNLKSHSKLLLERRGFIPAKK